MKLFETGIEASFEKSLEKYKNRLSRSTKAYEILLEREIRFYERIEPIFAELVPLAHDLLYYMTRDEDVERKIECEEFKLIIIWDQISFFGDKKAVCFFT